MTYALLAGLCFYISRQFASAAVATPWSQSRAQTFRVVAANVGIVAAVVLMMASLLVP